MAHMETKSFACDIGVLVGHAPVRTWVMGAKANASDMIVDCGATKHFIPNVTDLDTRQQLVVLIAKLHKEEVHAVVGLADD